MERELEGLKDEGIPEFGTLDGVVTELGKIFTGISIQERIMFT